MPPWGCHPDSHRERARGSSRKIWAAEGWAGRDDLSWWHRHWLWSPLQQMPCSHLNNIMSTHVHCKLFCYLTSNFHTVYSVHRSHNMYKWKSKHKMLYRSHSHRHPQQYIILYRRYDTVVFTRWCITIMIHVRFLYSLSKRTCTSCIIRTLAAGPYARSIIIYRVSV